MRKENLPREISKLGIVMNFGVVVISNVVVASIVGYYLDKVTLNNRMVFVIFLFLGVISGIYNGIRFLMKEAEKLERKGRK